MQIGLDSGDPNILHFDVEMEDGTKFDLPYQLGTNIFTAAHDFLMKNNLPYSHLNDVANFIEQNTKGMKPQTTILPALQRKTFPIKNYDKLEELLRVACPTDGDLIAVATMAQFIKAGKGFSLTAEMKQTISTLVVYALNNFSLFPPLFDLFGGLCLKCTDAVKYFETTNVYSQLSACIFELYEKNTITMPQKIMFIKFVANCFVTCPPELFMEMVHSTYGKLMPMLKTEYEKAVTDKNVNMETAIVGVLLNFTIAAISSSLASMMAEGIYEMVLDMFVKTEEQTVKALLMLAIGNFVQQDQTIRLEFMQKKEIVERMKSETDTTIQAIWKELNELVFGVSN